MDHNKAFIAQTFNNGRPNQVYGYKELRYARARATLYMKEEGWRNNDRFGVKVFEADLDSMTLTQVDERGTFEVTPLPGQSTLF